MVKRQVQQKMNSSKTAQVSTSAGRKAMPTLVKVISVLYYIGAALLLLFAILFFAGASFVGTLFVAELGTLGTGLFIVLGIVFLALAVLDFFIARGLWKGKNWARILVIILSILGVLGSISGLVQGTSIGSNIFGLIFSGLIGYYLLFTRQAKEAFA